VLLLAAGRGERLGSRAPKAFVDVAGRPLLEYSLETIERSGVAEAIVLVAGKEQLDHAKAIVREGGRAGMVRAIVAGGSSRQGSVRRGLLAVDPAAELVLCHDAARPFASPALFVRVAEALSRPGGEAAGAVPVIRTADTVKRIRAGTIVETIPRDEIGLAQTPQAFLASALREAHERAADDALQATDDAALLEAAGFSVIVVEGEPSNFKITTEEDLRRAERFLSTGERHRAEAGSDAYL
jgi:2-C-methyl-D-erythritol 4-phosphate cytidylyltransferase